MIEVDSREMRLLALRQIIKLIEQGDVEHLAEQGLTESDQQRLHSLTPRDLTELAQMSQLRLRLDCDFGSLRFALDTHLNVRDRRTKADYFIANGASLQQLQDLFGLTRTEVATRRASLCPHHRRGRPALPPEDEREAIAATWKTLSVQDETRLPHDALVERHIRLHQAYPQVSIAALETIVLNYAHNSPSNGSKSHV